MRKRIKDNFYFISLFSLYVICNEIFLICNNPEEKEMKSKKIILNN